MGRYRKKPVVIRADQFFVDQRPYIFEATYESVEE